MIVELCKASMMAPGHPHHLLEFCQLSKTLSFIILCLNRKV